MGRKRVGREIQGRNPGYLRVLKFGEDERVNFKSPRR